MITSHCQGAGLAAALQRLLDDDDIQVMPFKAFANDAEEAAFVDAIRGADVWIAMGHRDLEGRHRLLQDQPGMVYLPCPEIMFSAFHPDLCYLRRSADGGAVEPHYNSAIVAWAYLNRLPEDAAAALFTPANFRALGYLSRWGHSVAQLQAIFEQKGWAAEFGPFMRHVQRGGNFMHSINHPQARALVHLARLVAARLGADAAVLARDVHIPDAFADDDVWPLYPPVADALGLPDTGYTWRLWGRQRMAGVRAYTAFAYARYAALGLGPGDFHIDVWGVPSMAQMLDHVLQPQRQALA